MNIQQFRYPETDTCSYLLWDRATREALIIDPVIDRVALYTQTLREKALTLRYSLETHVHTDHITGSGKLRKLLGCTVMLHENSQSKHADILLRHGDKIPLGGYRVLVIHTPGHTDTDVCYLVHDMVFTGDTLLINSCGRTDYESGDAGKLYDSITGQLFTLPDNTVVYPGHDYHDRTHSTILAEKTGNEIIGNGRTRDGFIRIMADQELASPIRSNQAFTANLSLGLS